MSAIISNNENHVQTHHYETSTKTNSKDSVDETIEKWLHELLLQGFQGLGNASSREEGEDGTSTQRSSQGGTQEQLQAIDTMIADSRSDVTSLFGTDIAADTSIYFDEGQNDPDLIALFEASGSGPAEGAEGNNPIFGEGGIGEETSIYGLAALVLLFSMENKRSIIANRLDQIETTNNRVQEITQEVSTLKAAGASLKADSDDKATVSQSVFTTIANNNLNADGTLDEKGTQELWDELGISASDLNNPDGIKMNKDQINVLAEKLTSSSESLSTQNQTRNIKLQQQISELQVTTQMNSAIIDQIKTLGSGIAQRI